MPEVEKDGRERERHTHTGETEVEKGWKRETWKERNMQNRNGRAGRRDRERDTD